MREAGSRVYVMWRDCTGHLSVIGNTVCMRQCSGTDENQASIPVHILLKRRRELVGQHARHDKTTDEVAGSNVICGYEDAERILETNANMVRQL